MLKDIVIKGARENNLKNIDVVIPKNKLVVLTGVSGSGKSTLAFDTIFAEGQRRYMESLSSYARMFLGKMKKPDVDSIDGLAPSIAIDQKTTSHNPRSIVGTTTEIYDYLRLLFSHIGVPYCPNCNNEIKSQTLDGIINKIMSFGDGEKISILSPIARGKKGTWAKELKSLKADGYLRVKIDGEVKTLDEDISLEKNLKHNIYVIVDRLVIKDNIQKRLTDSVETALKLSKGVIFIEHNEKEILFSTTHACPECGFSFDEILPRTFSFNSPFGACPDCNGLGFKQTIDVSKIVNYDKSLSNGGVYASSWSYDGAISRMFFRSVADHFGVSVDTPLKDLPKSVIDMILYGTKGEKINITYTSKGTIKTGQMAFEGVVPNLERRYRESNSDMMKNELAKYIVEKTCDTCDGDRLKKEVMFIKIKDKNIVDICKMSIQDAYEFFDNLKLNNYQKKIAEPIVKEIKNRLKFLLNVGLDYLSLNRQTSSLSGGEAQRIRLATQIGSGLTGVLYILDEPSIGLHQRDNDKLLKTLTDLRDLGNTVIVVEHDEDTMRIADHIIDIGKYAGKYGGRVIAEGKVEDIIANEESITGKYLSGKSCIKVPSKRRDIERGYITIKGAKHNNLKNIDVSIPLGVLTVITGVSGSGKSSLINETLYPAINNKLNRTNLDVGKFDEILGLEKIDKIINIDQSPIGKTPRSNPATYTNVFTLIRELYASTPDAKERGYKSTRFSFNVGGGRCEKCFGAGINKIEMYFLPDVFVECDECGGKRYNNETLEVKYKNKSIADVLDMTVQEANIFFENVPKIKNIIQTLADVGLGYIKLGQPATELSGGEAQRVKLATELSKRSTGKSMYILDEPTTGLHMYDVDKLIKILNKLVESGNSVVVIEHNLDVVKCADYIIDLGPEGGNKGGQIVTEGTPEQVMENNIGYTARYLKKHIKNSKC